MTNVYLKLSQITKYKTIMGFGLLVTNNRVLMNVFLCLPVKIHLGYIQHNLKTAEPHMTNYASSVTLFGLLSDVFVSFSC